MKKTALILSGPTHEYLDPVRFIGNASSGRMGQALAHEALRHGYTVEFISGPVDRSCLPQLDGNGSVHHVVSADEMLSTAGPLFPEADVIVFAAAVADYAPAEKYKDKMAKADRNMILHLRPTADIAKTLCSAKKPDQVAIGFALQTAAGETNARRKLQEKNLDGIVLNTPETLGADDGIFSFLRAGSPDFEHWGRLDKAACSERIFEAIEQLGAY